MKKSKVVLKELTDLSRNFVQMPIINPFAAGIDIGSKEHYVCVAQNKVRKFGVTMYDFEQIDLYLKEHNIKSVALESTGFYWKNLYIFLQSRGYEVIVVNGGHIKNVKGKKTDVVDCRWIQLLHSVGLLSASFQPDDFTESLRVYVRHRQKLIQELNKFGSIMNKNLVLLNIQSKTIFSDITGKSSLKVIKAIIDGERNAEKLAEHISKFVHAPKEDQLKALQGNWRDEYLYELKQAYASYMHFSQQISEVDQEIEKHLSLGVKHNIDKKMLKDSYEKPKKQTDQKNSPNVDVLGYSYAFYDGIDFAAVDGFGPGTILSLISELGHGITKFPSGKNFVSWLGFSPNNKITGGKIIKSRTKKQRNPLAQAIMRAANSIGRSENPLGNFFRSIAFRRGWMIAKIATARKLALIIYKMLTEKVAFDYKLAQKQEEKIRKKRIKNIQKSIRDLQISQAELNMELAV
jgi:transposase